jgi:hemoglobin-like flavoprotein
MEPLMLTAEDVMLVRASFARVAAIQEAAADLFYARLFEVAPQVRQMFPEDLAEQKKKLMAMLAMAVGSLGELDALVPQVKALGARHVAYGAELTHYNVVGPVLLWTLEKGLGEAFTPAVRTAWFKVYSLLATTMQVGAAEAAELQAAE